MSYFTRVQDHRLQDTGEKRQQVQYQAYNRWLAQIARRILLIQRIFCLIHSFV